MKKVEKNKVQTASKNIETVEPQEPVLVQNENIETESVIIELETNESESEIIEVVTGEVDDDLENDDDETDELDNDETGELDETSEPDHFKTIYRTYATVNEPIRSYLYLDWK